MTNCLICTTNKDKFTICHKILSSIGIQAKFHSLNDLITKTIKMEERGTIELIAKNKVFHFLNTTNNNKFDLLIGIDDGFKLTQTEIPDSNSKEFVKKTLLGKFPNGTKIWNCRAYYIYNTQKSIGFSLSIETPYIYKKPINKKEISTKGYPLSKVLHPINSDQPISELTAKEALEYYLKFYPKSLTLNC